MAEDKKNGRPLGFAGERPEAIDHRTPPKPLTAGKSAPAKPDHFNREQPATIAMPGKTAPVAVTQSPKP